MSCVDEKGNTPPSADSPGKEADCDECMAFGDVRDVGLKAAAVRVHYKSIHFAVDARLLPVAPPVAA